MVLVGYTQQLVLKGDSMHCCSCSKSVHQCCPCSKVQASNDNVCHDQCVASHDDTTRFGATMHQLLCKILVIMQLACKWSHSTKLLLWMSNINNLSKIKHNYIVWSLLLLLLSLITYSSLHHVTIVVAYFYQCYHCSPNIEKWFKYLVACLDKVLKTNQLGINFTKNKL